MLFKESTSALQNDSIQNIQSDNLIVSVLCILCSINVFSLLTLINCSPLNCGFEFQFCGPKKYFQY
jgi:hypothetical protein